MARFAGRLIFHAVWASAVIGCSLVELSPGAQTVRIVAAQEIRHCSRLGNVTTTTTTTIALIPRDRDSIATDIQNLARNHAASMNGDRIVAASPLAENEQSFDVYRCLNR